MKALEVHFFIFVNSSIILHRSTNKLFELSLLSDLILVDEYLHFHNGDFEGTILYWGKSGIFSTFFDDDFCIVQPTEIQ